MEIDSGRRLMRHDDSWQHKLALLRKHRPHVALSLARRLLAARWSLRHATAVGRYVKLAGRLRVVNQGRLVVGNQVLFHAQVATTELAVLPGGELSIGDGTFINYGAEISAKSKVIIGEECRIGTHCIIMDNDFHYIELARRDQSPPGEPVIIEPHVWIGNRVTILKGVRIGYGSVVAAGSVVTKSIPAMSIAAGVPARVLRSIDGVDAGQPQDLDGQAARLRYVLPMGVDGTPYELPERDA
jgi:acetyltransferase-like isoleucine patch superfamily enzyme